ncbi:hypothetical protein AHAS_Ahas13G0237400 [Arachis hypogaea]
MQPSVEAGGGNGCQADGGVDVSAEADGAKSIGTEDNHLKLGRWRGGRRRERRCGSGHGSCNATREAKQRKDRQFRSQGRSRQPCEHEKQPA